MAEFISEYAPNRKTAVDSTNSTSWLVVNSDGSTAASRAASVAAGKTPFPGLDPGMIVQKVLVQNVTNTNTIYVAWNTDTTPTADTSIEVLGGAVFTVPGDVHEIWIGKATGTDHVVLTAIY